MPSTQPGLLVDAILEAISQSGEAGVITSSIRVHPREFAVEGPDGPLLLWVYAWTLTPGGRPQLPNEYRIQMTTVQSPLALNPIGPTLLLGYEPSLGIFGGFDLTRHRRFTVGSPSVQIDLASLRTALQDGLAFHRKSNTEITVAIRPDQFMLYARNATLFHKEGSNTATFRTIQKAATREPLPHVAVPRTERKRLIQLVSRAARAANFSDQVLIAYAHRCAVTRLQLRLVDAAHILPVAAPGSPDHVSNGLALSPTYHRAFDHGLIYLDEGFVMRLNPKRLNRLETLNLQAGIEEFKSVLGKIHLPPDRLQWPDVKLVRLANEFRRIELA